MATETVQDSFRRFTGLLTGSSILMILLGLIAIALPFIAGVAISILVGWLIVFGGIAYLVHAFAARGVGAFLWRALVGVFYIVGGLYLAFHPALSLVTLTLLLAVLFLVEGIMAIISFFHVRGLPGSWWLLFDGVVTLILSVMIWRTWPVSAVWVVGTLVGINLLLSGFTRLFYASAARRVATVLP